MLDQLIHLLFSNLWVLIVLFWVFRGLIKAGSPRLKRQNHRPVRTHPVPVTSTMVTQPIPEPVWEKQETGKKEQKAIIRKRDIEKKEERKKSSFPSPREGMMWSEVFGPPRSKQPHQIKRHR